MSRSRKSTKRTPWRRPVTQNNHRQTRNDFPVAIGNRKLHWTNKR